MDQIRGKDISFTCYKLEDSTEQMYSKMQEAYGSDGVFTFVDLRKILQENRQHGHVSSSSGFVKSRMSEEMSGDIDYRYRDRLSRRSLSDL